MAQARQQTIEAACDEYRRLLYVALTRAADRLRCAAPRGIKALKVAGMTLVLSALQLPSEEGRDNDGRLWRFRKGLPVTADQRDRTPQPRAELPAWLTTYATASPRRVRILRPSDAPEEEDISPAGRGVDREAARLRRSRTGCCSRCRIFPPRGGERPLTIIWHGTAARWPKTSAPN